MGGRLALALALRIPERVERLVLDRRASPGLADAGERAARRAADEALADRIEAIGVEAFAREWGAQPLFAGQPPRRRRSRARGPAAAQRGRARRRAARARHRRDAAAVGPARRAPMPVTLVVGERDAKFRAIAERMGCPDRGRRRAPGMRCSSRRRPPWPRTSRFPRPLAARRKRSYPRPMLRTSRTYRRGLLALTWLGEWRFPPPERRAARSRARGRAAAVARARRHPAHAVAAPGGARGRAAALGRLGHVAFGACPGGSARTSSRTPRRCSRCCGRTRRPARSR